ncbi:hypothetical protein Tco_1563647 [Tanacetum coccineum]
MISYHNTRELHIKRFHLGPPVFDDDQYEKEIVSGDVENGFVDNYLNFQEDGNNLSFLGVVLRVEEESMPVYDTDIKEVFVGKGGFCGGRRQHRRRLIMEYLVKICKKERILELKRRHLKINVLTSNTPYPSRKIRRICACTSQKTTKETRSIRRDLRDQQVRTRNHEFALTSARAEAKTNYATFRYSFPRFSFERTVERRQKRMIKSGEHVARSRGRKTRNHGFRTYIWMKIVHWTMYNPRRCNGESTYACSWGQKKESGQGTKRTETEGVWGSKKPEKETEKGFGSSSWGETVVTGN